MKDSYHKKSIMCYGAPLGIATEYQELADMSFYSTEEAGGPAFGGKKDWPVPHKMCNHGHYCAPKCNPSGIDMGSTDLTILVPRSSTQPAATVNFCTLLA